ncbi:UDP-N-acetyl-D-glucosamine dehydrogenase [Salinibacter ruber]|uniref:nucleotide sugar dehydrogenase n=1 Tax=Salinibacter ruber TaxID=146919 RepID=UPI000E57F3D9|nr:nucleotide sugar dehydrogenase [Salinibacter ruber]MCS3705902.1 UDP-N-acetyl-D-glucosamine dehydrogenase [Salinibacter ruber]
MQESQPTSTETAVDLVENGTDAAARLVERIETRKATVGVIGLGYVGLPLAVEYAGEGFPTVGIDLDEDRVTQLNAGRNYIDDVDDTAVREHVEADRLTAVPDFSRSADIDVFLICVPTPVTETNEPDTSYIESATRSIAEHLRPGQLVVIKSTTYPSTTEEVVLPILQEEAGSRELEVGRDVFLAFSPERIDPGNEEYTTANTPVVVGGATDLCTEVAAQAIEQVVAEVHQVSNSKVAEMEKLLENIFRSVNIALVNELAQLCDRIGDVSMWEVVEAAATKPFGFMPFYPGPGLGGHCIPVDPHYLSWLAQKHDFETSFITLAASVNEEMPFYVVQSVVEAIARAPVQLEKAQVLVLGVAFKGNVDDTRHSPAETVIKQLQDKGIDHIQYHDPHVSSYHVPSPNGEQVEIPSVELVPDVLRRSDVVVITTDHDAYDTEMIAQHASRIVDTRNALGDIEDPTLREKIMLIGGGAQNGRA